LVKVAKIEVPSEAFTVNGLVVSRGEAWINIIDVWGRVFALSENWASLHVMKDHIKIV
jgi:hypothetical protein